MMGEASAHWAGALLTVLLGRGLVVFAAAYAVTALARKLSSESRHLIWMGVVGSFVVIPLTWLLLPPLHLGSWIPAEPRVFYSIDVAPVVSHQEYLMHWTSQGCPSGGDKVWSGNTLARIDPAGTIWEANYSGYGGYPDVTGFGPAGPGYSVMYRQQ